MSRLFRVITVACACMLLLHAVAGQLPQWSLASGTTTMKELGVGGGQKTAVVAGADTKANSFVMTYDGRFKKTQVKEVHLLDAATSDDGQIIVATGSTSVTVSTDGGKTFQSSNSLRGSSQSATILADANGNQVFALVGDWQSSASVSATNATMSAESISGVAISADLGATWKISPVPIGHTRYGAFPSEKVWYVSSGAWGSDPSPSSATKLSARVSLASSGELHFHQPSKPGAPTTADDNGWFAAVSKTVDGGNTWSQVFLSDLQNDYFYFNGISCSTELNCVVVGEGDSPVDGSSQTVVYATSDGGLTWVKSLTTADLGMTGSAFVSSAGEGEVWVAGTGTSRVGMTLLGHFYKSVNGGKTFELAQSLEGCTFVMDLDFGGNGVGYAACADTVAIYN